MRYNYRNAPRVVAPGREWRGHWRRATMVEYNTKRCSQCKQYYPATNEYFYANKNTRCKLSSWCKTCQRKSQHTPEYKKRQHDYEHSSHRKELKKQYEQTPQRKQYRQQWEKTRPPKFISIKANPSRLEKKRLYDRIEHHKRRAERQGNKNILTANEWEDILAEFNYSCAYCGKGWHEISGKLAQDHVIPFSRGGTYTKNNIVPACRSCNSKKHNKTPEEAGMPIRRHD